MVPVASVNVFHVSSDESVNAVVDACWKITDTGAFAESVADIARRLGINQAQVSAQAKRCHVEVSGVDCQTCGGAFVVESRTDFAELLRHPSRPCAECIERSADEKRTAEREQADRRRRLIDSRYPAANVGKAVPIEHLSLLESLALAAWFRTDEGLGTGSPPAIDSLAEPLTPARELTIDLVKALFERG